MADPFSVSPPAWVQSLSKPVDQEAAGKAIGLGLMSIVNSFKRNTQADEEMGLGKAGDFAGINSGIVETRLNSVDPLWKSKLHMQMETQRLNQKQGWQQVELGAKRLTLTDNQLDAAKKMKEDDADDAQTAAKWQAEVGNDLDKRLNSPAPLFKTAKAQLQFERMRQTDAKTPQYLDKIRHDREVQQFQVTSSRNLDTMLTKVPPQFAAQAASILAIPDFAKKTEAANKLFADPAYVAQREAAAVKGLKAKPVIESQPGKDGKPVWYIFSPSTGKTAILNDKDAAFAKGLQQKITDAEARIKEYESKPAGTTLSTVEQNRYDDLKSKRAGYEAQLHAMTNATDAAAPAAPLAEPTPATVTKPADPGLDWRTKAANWMHGRPTDTPPRKSFKDAITEPTKMKAPSGNTYTVSPFTNAPAQ